MKKGKLFTIFIWAVTICVSFIILFPVYWIFLSSITPKDMLFTRPINYIPIRPTLMNYIDLFNTLDIFRQARNTLVFSSLTIVFTITISTLAAYAFARISFPGKGLAFMFLISSAMLPLVVMIIPLYQTFRELGLVNSLTSLVIINTSAFIPFTTMTLSNFIQGIPISIEEAADVDGANALTKIFRVLFPLLRPAVATMAIIIFIWCMNEFMVALVFTNARTMPLSVGITMIPRIDVDIIPWDKISALASIMLLPIVLFVMIFEENIMEGLMSGSIKQ